MANTSAKKLIRANKARLNTLRFTIALANLMYASVRLGLRRSSFDAFYLTAWLVLIAFYLLPFWFLWAAARPRYFEDGSINHGGEDISASGLFEYAHDVIYLSVFVQFGLLFTKWALAIFTVVPIYAIYAMCFAGAKSDMMPEEPEADTAADMAGMSRKERRKAAREARKTR